MKAKQIPNILSALRIALVPLFAWAFLSRGEGSILPALGIYLFAGLTDVADGMLARRYNWMTPMGKILDPLADKLMQSAALVCLAVEGTLGGKLGWLLVAAFFCKELFIAVGALVVFKKIHITVKSDWYGKAATAVFYAAVFFSMVLHEKIGPRYGKMLFTAAFVAAVAAAVMYTVDMVRLNRQIKRGGAETEKTDV